MRTRTFSEEEKIELKQKMKSVGWPMLQEQGLTHMSISKLTSEVGIGKSTFYSFYASKEEFVEEMLNDNRKQIMETLHRGLNGREKYSKEEAKTMICNMISDTNRIYKHFSSEDEEAIKKMYEKKGMTYLDISKEKQVIDFLASMMDGVKQELDHAVIANLMKVIVLAGENREMLHEEGYQRTKEMLINVLIQEVFE